MSDNLGDKRNTNGFDKNPENINRKGRTISIKKQLKEILLNEGEFPIPATSLIRETEKDGKKYYVFKIPTQYALAMKLVSLAMSAKSNSFNSLKLLLETFDGKPKQEIDIGDDLSKKLQIIESKSPEEITKEIDILKEKLEQSKQN